MFCKKLQNVCPEAANADQMDKNGYDFWTQHPQNPQTRHKLQVSKNPVYWCANQRFNKTFCALYPLKDASLFAEKKLCNQFLYHYPFRNGFSGAVVDIEIVSFPLTPTKTNILALGFLVITRQLLQLERCSNPLRIQQV